MSAAFNKHLNEVERKKAVPTFRDERHKVMLSGREVTTLPEREILKACSMMQQYKPESTK